MKRAKPYIEELNTALLNAASNGYVDEIINLLKQGAEIDVKDDIDVTPLHLATLRAQVEAMKVLVESGATIDAKDRDGSTPLHIAALQGLVETMRVLLDSGATIDAKDNQGSTPLHIAVEFGQLKAMGFLLEKGATIDAADAHGNTPMHIAAVRDKVEAMRLLQKNGAIVEIKNNNGYTPLHYATSNINAVMSVRFLLEHGASSEARSNNGTTPLQVGAANGNEIIIQLLAKEATDDKNRFVSRSESNQEKVSALDLILKKHPQLLRSNQNDHKSEGRLVSNRRQHLRDNSLYYLLDMLQSQEIPSVHIDLKSVENEKNPTAKMSEYSKDSACKLGLGLFFQLPEELKVYTMQFLHSGPLAYTSREDEKARRIANSARTSKHLFEPDNTCTAPQLLF